MNHNQILVGILTFAVIILIAIESPFKEDYQTLEQGTFGLERVDKKRTDEDKTYTVMILLAGLGAFLVYSLKDSDKSDEELTE